MQIFLTGGTGLIGRRLVLNRLERGDRVVILSRSAGRATQLFAADVNPNVIVVEGDPCVAGEWQRFVDGCDAVIHLAGANVGDRRWNESYKRELYDSRVVSTHRVVDAIAAAERKPRIFLAGSAIGFYGGTGFGAADETTPGPSPGRDFLSDLSRDWEAAAKRATEHGVRLVHLRTGIVLDSRGGSFLEMLKPFRFFAGGWLGSGRQYISWIHYRDAIGLIDLALRRSELRGPLNLVSPGAVSGRDLARAIGAAMGRAAWLPAPSFALKLVVGEFAKFILMSQRIAPAKAIEFGYHFLFPEIGPAAASLVEEIHRRKTTQTSFGVSSIDMEYVSEGTAKVLKDSPTGSVAALPNADRERLTKPRAKIRLLALDVDGTLLRSDGRLAQGVIDACRAAERAGCVVVPATARPPRSLQSIVQTLGTTGPTINYNGAVIWNPVDQTAQHHQALDPDLAKEIIAEARTLLPELVVSVEILDRWFTDRIDPSLHTETSRIFEPDYVGPFDDYLNQPVTKLLLLAHPSILNGVVEMVKDRYWTQRHVSLFITDPHVIQISHPLVDKAVALQRIARRLGASRDEVMAIGDGPNDAGMIEWSGFGVAVENACELVRSLADVVVPSNDALGVAKAVQRYVLNSS